MAASLKNRRLETLQSMGIDPVALPFSFQLNGVSAPTLVQGLQCSVARSDTGLFTVTLPAAFPSASAVMLGLPEVTGAKGGGSTSGLQFEAAGSPISGTFQIRTMNAGTTTLVDVAASTTVRVNGVVFAAAAGTRAQKA